MEELLLEWSEVGIFYLDNKQKQPIKSFVRLTGLIQRVHMTRYRQRLRATSKRILEVKELASTENKIRKLNVF